MTLKVVNYEKACVTFLRLLKILVLKKDSITSLRLLKVLILKNDSVTFLWLLKFFQNSYSVECWWTTASEGRLSYHIYKCAKFHWECISFLGPNFPEMRGLILVLMSNVCYFAVILIFLVVTWWLLLVAARSQF